MKQNVTEKVPKSSNIFRCEFCDYESSRKSQYERHLTTDKHKSRTFVTEKVPKSSDKYECNNCNAMFNNRTTLWRHKNNCFKKDIITPELVMELIRDNKEMRNTILVQNNTILEQNTTITNLVKNGISNNVNSLNNNNNKTFNLQFFLNETCKDAMNIMDFVDSIKLQLSDLENVGKLGYVEGISNIITTNLKALDVTQRPVHCTDKKRETVYVKDDNQWIKEDVDKSKLRKAIKRVANKNIKLLPKFREKYPDYSNSDSSISDKYSKIVIESMVTETEKEDKIIHNISKCTTIEKYQDMCL